MRYNLQNIIRRFENGEKLSFVYFWGHTESLGKVTKACFSQWYLLSFVVDGVKYACAEQYMMAQKALLFGDQVTYEKIMAAVDPKVRDPHNWKGENLLGFALMEARDMLRGSVD